MYNGGRALLYTIIYWIINNTHQKFHLRARAQEDEIPIWICGEPRFISGLTCSTTCDQLIQALIDDELCNDAGDVRNDDKRGEYWVFYFFLIFLVEGSLKLYASSNIIVIWRKTLLYVNYNLCCMYTIFFCSFSCQILQRQRRVI